MLHGLRQALASLARHPYAALFTVSLLVLAQQAHVAIHWRDLPAQHRINGIVGAGGHHLAANRQFLRFFELTGHYPLASYAPVLPSRAEELPSWLKAHGHSLITEIYETYRYGEVGEIYLLLFDSRLSGGFKSAVYNSATSLLFVASLLGLLWSLWLQGRPALALAAVLLLGSSSFQLYETYVNANVFSIPITLALLCIAVNASLLVRMQRPLKPRHYLAAMVTGALIATATQLRSEPMAMVPAVVLIYATASGVSSRSRWLLCGLLALSFMASNRLWWYHFDVLHGRAAKFAEQHGGLSYPGDRSHSHEFWHPMWCGLGDYGSDKGYAWDDFAGLRFALPKIRDRVGRPDLWPNFEAAARSRSLPDYFLPETFDARGLYPKKLSAYPEYEEIIREKILSDIRHDPIWFAGIIVKRILHCLQARSGLELRLFDLHVGLNGWFVGFLVLPALWLAWRRGDGLALRLIVFTLPLGASAVVISAHRGLQYYVIADLFAAGYLVSEMPRLVRHFRQRSAHNT